MGKLGGREMTAASDLDLMLIYDHDEGAEASDGAKALMPSQYYGRLTQRLINAVAAQTAEGRLYEVDMRLRPSGNKGPIATHVQSFIDYHRESAWTWEKLALTRARPIAGDAGLAIRMRTAIRDVLCRPRDAAATAFDVAQMRRRIAEEKPARGAWDLKLVRGGLVDIEFLCQFFQIAHAAEHQGLLDPNTGTVLSRLADAGVLPAAQASDLEAAYRLMATLNQILTLSVQSLFDPGAAPDGLIALMLRATDMPDMTMLDHALKQAQQGVKHLFHQVVEQNG
jgi:glutamate-ammonia-ligase adenylyltransferase